MYNFASRPNFLTRISVAHLAKLDQVASLVHVSACKEKVLGASLVVSDFQ